MRCMAGGHLAAMHAQVYASTACQSCCITTLRSSPQGSVTMAMLAAASSYMLPMAALIAQSFAWLRCCHF